MRRAMMHFALFKGFSPERDRMKREPNPKLRAIWKATHADYKGIIDGVRCVLVLREGGTCSVSLSSLTNEEIESKLPKDFA